MQWRTIVEQANAIQEPKNVRIIGGNTQWEGMVTAAAAFTLGCLVTFMVMHPRETYEECLVAQSRGVPRWAIVEVYSICEARHPNAH